MADHPLNFHLTSHQRRSRPAGPRDARGALGQGGLVRGQRGLPADEATGTAADHPRALDP